MTNFFTCKHNPPSSDINKLRNNLHNSLINEINEFYFVFQPIYSLELQDVTEYEVLSRWQNGELGHIPPDSFISVLENTGMMFLFWKTTIDRILKQFLVLKKQKPWVCLNINISPILFVHDEFLDCMNTAVKINRLKLSDINIEITECCQMSDNSKLFYCLHKAKESGYKVSLDDFGTGYNSFPMLKEFNFDYVKVDKSYTDNILRSDKNDLNLIKTLQYMTSLISTQLVVEGVETIEQLSLLRSVGIDKLQGYYISKPLPVNDLKYYHFNII